MNAAVGDVRFQQDSFGHESPIARGFSGASRLAGLHGYNRCDVAFSINRWIMSNITPTTSPYPSGRTRSRTKPSLSRTSESRCRSESQASAAPRRLRTLTALRIFDPGRQVLDGDLDAERSGR